MKQYIIVTHWTGEYEDAVLVMDALLILEGDITKEQIDTYVEKNMGRTCKWDILTDIRTPTLQPVMQLV